MERGIAVGVLGAVEALTPGARRTGAALQKRRCLPSPVDPIPEGFELCILHEGVKQCPEAYPRQHVFYGGIDDGRACSPCECGSPIGSDCWGWVATYQDSECKDIIVYGTQIGLKPLTACWLGDPPSPSGFSLGSKSAIPPIYKPGTCAPMGGEPMGAAVATGPSTLFGSSMGGLFASVAALERPESFDRYIIASPALWWDDHVLVRTVSQRPLWRGDAHARVFMAVGALEEGGGIPNIDGFRMVSNARDLAQRLEMRSAPGLDVRLQIFTDETHTSVVPAALTRGLRTLYELGRPVN